MANIYEIQESLRVLEEYMVDPETGEMLDEEQFAHLFDKIQMDLSTKIDNTSCFIKNLLADVDAYKAEAKKITERAKVKANLAERLENRLNHFIKMIHTNEDGELDTKALNAYKFETPRCKISYRKSEKVEVADTSLVDEKYLKIKEVVEPNKDAIKKAIKAGEEVVGAELEVSYNIQIK